MNDFPALLETIIILFSGKLIIAGDFNFHMDDVPLNQDASLFMYLLDYYGLVQRVSSSTHARGHLFDLIITKPDTFVGSYIDASVSFTLPSDHALVRCSIAMPRPKPVRIQVNHRKLRDIDGELLRDDIIASCSNKQMADLSHQVDFYNSSLWSLLEKKSTSTLTIYNLTASCALV